MYESKLHDFIRTFDRELVTRQQNLYDEYQSFIVALDESTNLRALYFVESDIVYLFTQVKAAIKRSKEKLQRMEECTENIKELAAKETEE